MRPIGQPTVLIFFLGASILAALGAVTDNADIGGSVTFQNSHLGSSSSSGTTNSDNIRGPGGATNGAVGNAGYDSTQSYYTAAGRRPAVGLLLQLTDVHISTLEGPAGDPQRAPDLMAMAAGMLSRWPLAAAVLTGDLTEAKDVYGRGNQYEREWQIYRDTWNALSSPGNVPYDQIYDIRGNHDTFNSGPRCGVQDYYCTYSVRAARVNQKINGTTTADGGQGGPWDRVFIDAVYGRIEDGRGSRTGSGRCPLAVLVGVDASLDPGMRSPTNFLGVVPPAVLDELDEQLAASVTGMRAVGCTPPYIAYGHYPLSTISYPGRRRTGASGAAAAASVQQVLVRHGVSSYLAGHLHGAFGHKLHRLHKAPIATDSRPMSYMLELEMVDWKHARTVRLLTSDLEGGGAVSFADFRYIPGRPQLPSSLASTVRQEAEPTGAADPGARQDGAANITHRLEPFDATCVVGAYLPLITCPPDARYSPQLTTAPYSYSSGCSSSAADAANSNNSIAATAVVRVMLLPVGDAVPAVSTDTVYLHWFCDFSGEALGVRGDGGGGGGGGRNLPGIHTVRKHRRLQSTEMKTSLESSAPGLSGDSADNNGIFDGLGGGGGGSSSSSSSNCGTTTEGGRGRLSGFMKMQLEFASVNYSIYTADLLRPVHVAPEAVAGPPASRVGGGSVRSCPPGFISVQVCVGGGAGSDSNSATTGVGGDGDGARGGMSSSAERLLHWYPPAAAAPPAASHSRPAAAATPSRDTFWSPTGDSDSLSSVHCPPARLQQTVLEWLVMHVPWHRFGLVAAAAHWCVLTLGMLAAPRVFAVLKARRTQSQERQRTSSARQARWRHQRQQQRLRNGVPGSRIGCGSDEAEQGDADLRHPTTEVASAAVAVPRRQLDWMGECVSTSIRLGGMCGSKNGKSAALKRSSSGSSTGGGVGVGVSAGTREAQSGGGDASITQKGVHTGPLNLEEDPGGGGANNAEEVTSLGGSWGTTMHSGRTAWKIVRCWLLWPLRDLAELAEQRDYVPWLALVLYGVYLAVGPWFMAEFITMHAGTGSTVQPSLGGYGFLAAYGIYMRSIPMVPRDGSQRAGTDSRWFAAPSQDHVVIVNVVAVTCIAPGLLLCASAAARLRQMAVAGKLDFRIGRMRTWQILSWRQTAALCGIAVLDVGICWKLWGGLGWTAIAMSPGVGWLLPLLAAWLCLTSSRAATLGQQPDREMT